MATRRWPGLGPVFAYEWLTAARRWQGYALRSLLVLLLLLGLSAVWLENHGGAGELSLQKLAEIGRAFYAVTTLILLGLVGLAAPAASVRSVAKSWVRLPRALSRQIAPAVAAGAARPTSPSTISVVTA